MTLGKGVQIVHYKEEIENVYASIYSAVLALNLSRVFNL